MARTSCCAPWFMLIPLLCIPLPARAAVDCHITTSRPARVFYPGDQVHLFIRANVPSQRVGYEIRNYEGRVEASGFMTLSHDHPDVLRVHDLTTGIYRLKLEFDEGTVTDSFCVIPRPDADARDGALWGYQLQWGFNDELCAALAQAGVRYVRFDLTWPDHEPARGKFSTTKADLAAARLGRWGLQMVPTLGYTPGWTGLPPDDYPTRAHTWAPDSVEEWLSYVTLLRDRLGPQVITWPSPEVVEGLQPHAVQRLPLVRWWEIWNEADQNFYYGPWSRYTDLLRVAHSAIKARSFLDQVVYGGSCAHWTEMGKTCAAGGHMYCDLIAWHSNNDIERQLPSYYYGPPQITYKSLLPRHTVHTECYPTTKSGVGEAEYLLRLFATLKAWREEGYCLSSIGDRLIGPPDPNSPALTYRTPDGQLAPNAKYVAYAVCRWLLDDAAYLGPLNLGDNVTAHLFARRGDTLLVAWSDTGASVALDYAPAAQRVDIMGRVRPVGTHQPLQLSGAPTVILGVADSYIPTAMAALFERWMRTEYGFDYPVDSPYVRPMELDSWGGAEIVRKAIGPALRQLVATFPRNTRALDAVATSIRDAMMLHTNFAVTRQYVRPENCTATWRWQKLAEWLAEASDALEGQTRGKPLPRQAVFCQRTVVTMTRLNGLSPLAAADPPGPGPGPGGGPPAGPLPQPDGPPDWRTLWQELEAARAQVVDDQQGTIYPFGEALINRAFSLAHLYRLTARPAVALAARNAAQVATNWALVKPLQRLTGVFAVAHFPTARLMKKAYLLWPAQEHTLQVQAYNFSPRSVSGTLRWTLPETWSPASITVPFDAPAGGYSPRLSCSVRIPGGPEPWDRVFCGTTGGGFWVKLPHGLAHRADLILGGELSDGRQLVPVPYEVWIGIWQP